MPGDNGDIEKLIQSVEAEPGTDPAQEAEFAKETPDDLPLSMEEFISMWRNHKVLVADSTGVKPIPHQKFLETEFRELVKILQHMGFKHNPEGEQAHKDLVKTHKMELGSWKKLYFYAKLMHMPEHQSDPIVLNTAARGVRQVATEMGVKKGSRLILPPGSLG